MNEELKPVKIHIGILTHNRPDKFKRCLESVFRNLVILRDYENKFSLYVACDDESVNYDDILNYCNEHNSKIQWTLLKLKKTDDLSDNYKNLVELIKTKSKLYNDYENYCYILEDDDELLFNSLNNMLATANISRKNVLFNYEHGYGKKYENKYKMDFLEYKKIQCKDFDSSLEILEQYNPKHFQLGMMLFNINNLNMEDFPNGNIMENDLELFKKISGEWTVSSLENYKQGWNNDNISRT